MTEKIGVLGTKAPQRTGAERVVNAPLPTVYGKFQAVGYLDHDRGDEQVALVYGDIGSEDVLTGCTPNASPGTPSVRSTASAATNSPPRCGRSSRKAAASSSTCAVTRAGG